MAGRGKEAIQKEKKKVSGKDREEEIFEVKTEKRERSSNNKKEYKKRMIGERKGKKDREK